MYITQDIANRIKSRLKAQHISTKEMLFDLDMGINAISEFAKGKQMSCINLARIADYLDCSVDYLLGRTDTPTVEVSSNIGSITPLEAKVLLAYREKKNMQAAVEHLLDVNSASVQKEKPDVIIGQIAAFGNGPADIPVDKEASQKLAALAKKKRDEKKGK